MNPVLTLWPNPDDLEIATPHQRERVGMAMRKPVGILGGNPGAGKTTMISQIIGCCIREHGLGHVAVAAPTGKAAVRITEAMQDRGLNDVQATTIHRLLGVSRNGHDRKGWGFMHNKNCPLPYRFIFLDEASMLDCNLAASLMEACLPGTHILFSGDFGQLPPVGHGRPLMDMIDAGMPYGELEEIHRNGGDIVVACKSLKEGRPIQPSAAINLELGHNLKHIEAARPAKALGALANLLRSVPAGIDPVWDVQVLCAVNEKSEVGRKNLNEEMQRILNPNGAIVEGMACRLNDKVICSTNGMMPLVKCPSCQADEEGKVAWNGKWYECADCFHVWKPGECDEDFVANGEIGKVVLLKKKLMHVAFDSPQRTVRVTGEWLSQYELAYAVTTWKAQGSQWPVIICMTEDSHAGDHLCTWEFWRTGISRAEKICFTVGRKSAIDRQCRRSGLAARKTFLATLLKQGGIAA